MKARIVMITLAAALCGLTWPAATAPSGAPAVGKESPAAPTCRAREFNFEISVRPDFQLKDKPEKLQPAGWEKIVTKPGSPDYDDGFAAYNEGEVTAEHVRGGWNWFLQLTLEKGKVAYQAPSKAAEEAKAEASFIAGERDGSRTGWRRKYARPGPGAAFQAERGVCLGAVVREAGREAQSAATRTGRRLFSPPRR